MKKIGRVLKKADWKLAAVLMISLAMLIFYGNQKEEIGRASCRERV